MVAAGQDLAGHTSQMQHIKIQNELSSYMLKVLQDIPTNAIHFTKIKRGQ